MDFDDEDKPKEVSKTRRFAPGRAGKSKPKPKPEPPMSQTNAPLEFVSKSEHNVDAKVANPKVEPEVYNGPVKMEIDSKVDKEPATMEAELIEEDQVLPLQEEKDEEDVVVREIDVFFNPSIDANTKTVFSKERPLLHDWKFKEPTDVSFIKSYPEIVMKQDIFWTGKKADLEEHITKGGKSRADNRRNVPGKNPSVTVKPEVPTTLSDKGGSSGNTIPHVVRKKVPDELVRALLKALKKVFQTHKVCSYETICQGLRDLAVSTSNNPKAADSGMAQQVALAVDAYKEELPDLISKVTVNIHGSFVSKSSPDHPENDTLRDGVIQLLLKNGPGKKVMKADVFAAARIALKREITNNEYLKVMNELCETNSSGWFLQKAR